MLLNSAIHDSREYVVHEVTHHDFYSFMRRVPIEHHALIMNLGRILAFIDSS